MRAIAIALVMITHLWPTRLPGGYVGVDVFFVISGYLITAHLLGELTRTGSVRLGRFYARRIRRLIPAALTVLAAALALVVLFVPYPRWERNAWETLSSAAYVENWFLAAKSVNYSALNDAASAVQHYWSLSVEEQFYILWPVLLLIAGTALIRGRTAPNAGGAASIRRRVLIAVGLVGALSLALSVLYTALAPAPAYFATFTRAWEFAAGAMVAVCAPYLRLPQLARNVISIVGFALIAVAAILFDHTTPFPGWHALIPVAGAALIILAGTSAGSDAPIALWHDRITARRPVQWIGGVSYSLYLWHWPLIVVAPFALGASLSGPVRLGILAVTLLLAALTKRFIEDGGGRWRFWKDSTLRAFLTMLAGVAILAVAVGAVQGGYQARAEAGRPPVTVVEKPCVGPDALEPGSDCEDPFGRAADAVMTSRNEYFYTPAECAAPLKELTYADTRTTTICDFSGGAADPIHIAVIGDSHAQQWQGAVFDIARERRGIVTTSYFGGCPPTDADFIGFRVPWGAPDVQACRQWSEDIWDYVVETRPDVVFTTMASRQQLVDDGSGRPQAQQMADGLASYWQRWRDAGIDVVPIVNPPYNVEVRPADCLLLNEDDPIACARPRAEANPPDPIAAAAARVGIAALDLSDRFCDAANCYAAVGGMAVYYDPDHLNLEYVRLLAPDLGDAIDGALGGS